MPRLPRTAPPSYCLHRASGRAVVRIQGKDRYLGTYGSPESHAEYERLIAEWRLQQSQFPKSAAEAAHQPGTELSVAEVLLRYRRFAECYYVRDGERTQEFDEMGYALRPVRELYGDTLARDFGPLKLKAVRQHMIEVQGLSRGVVNRRVKRIKRCFKWAVSEELVPAMVSHALSTVGGLRRGRTNAREAPPVRPVPDEWVEPLLDYLSPQVAAMVQVQRLTGMRPGEVVQMRGCDIDRSGEVWIYQPQRHKNEWRERARVVPLGPKAQQAIAPFLAGRPEDSFLFSPQEAEEWRNEKRATQRLPNRKTKIYPSELRTRQKRKAAARKRKSKRPKHDAYDVDSYRRAITYGLRKANKAREQMQLAPIPHWHPLQLRHSRATEVRKSFGIEAAQVSLGHAHANVTEVYAERNLELAIKVAMQLG